MIGLPSEEREMVLDLISKLRQRMLTPERIRELDEKEEYPLDIMNELMGPDIGLQLLFIPEEYEGMGGGARDIAVVAEALGKICLGVSTAFLAVHLGTDPILVGATDEQKKKWLGKVAEEGAIVAYAVTEPDAGSNLSSLKTTADPVTDADGHVVAYKINGNKQFISNGGFADFMTVLAQTPEGPSFFIVEKDAEGFKPGKAEVKHGIRCSNTAPLTFENVVVPVENLLGGVPGKGLHQANEVFGFTRLMVASFALGAGVAALEKAIAYAKQRIQFGSPIFEKQGYTHKLIVPHVVRLEAARAYIEDTARRLDTREKDLQVEGAIAKYFTSEAGNWCADDAIQALGGYGYICEYDVEKIKRDVKITTIYEGTSEIQQMIIGTFRWRSTVRSKGAYYSNFAFELGKIHANIDDIQADVLENICRGLNVLTIEIHKAKLVRDQHVMFQLADIMTWTEIGVALLQKINRLASAGETKLEKLKLIARLFVAEVAAIAQSRTQQILYGSGKFSDKEISAVFAAFNLKPKQCFQNVIKDMDRLVTYL